jgi:hypothetical protein
MRTVIVICGGWSVTQYDVKDLRSRGHVIGVNESSVLVECHTGVTMDRLWAENRFRQFFTTRAGDLWVREGAAKNLPQHPRLRKYKCDHESALLSPDEGRLNGMNSGMVALNLAYQLRPHQVFVFGLDSQKGPNGEPYWHPPYDWPQAKATGNTTTGKYKAWAPNYGIVAEQFEEQRIELCMVSNYSKAAGIRAVSYGYFLELTK